MTMDALDIAIRDAFGGNAAQAILEIAHRHGITIAYLDRACFAAHVEKHRGEDRPLTDAEWDDLKRWLDPSEYDNWVDNTSGPTGNKVDAEFMNFALGSCQIAPPADDEPWEAETDKEPGYQGGW